MDIGDKGPVLFWIEDRPDTVLLQEEVLKNANVKYYMFGTPVELMGVLDDVMPDTNLDRLRFAFIIDLMLFGVNDLRSFSIDDAPTGNGIHAGYVFADRVLRAHNSRYLQKPICFLTERMLDQQLKDDVHKLEQKSGLTSILCRNSRTTNYRSFWDF
jgi:hypothetical protein